MKHGSMIDAATVLDNDSSTKLATTLFAKSQDAVLHREPDQAVALTAAVSGSSGITVADNANINFGTGNFALVWKGSLPDWTPSAIQEALIQKYDGGALSLDTNGTMKVFIKGLATYIGPSLSLSFVDGSTHELVAAIRRAGATDYCDYYADAILVNTVSFTGGGTVSSASALYIMGSSMARTAGTCIHAYTLNFAPTAAEVLDMYRNGIPESWKWGSQAELIAAQTNRDFSGANNWANPGNMASFDATTGGHLTLTASVAAQWVYLESSFLSAPLIIGKRYRITFTVSSIVAGWSIQNNGYVSYAELNSITSNGTHNGEFTATSLNNGIIRIISNNANSSGVFDNFSIVEIGATLALQSEGINHYQWQDSSSNQLHALMPAAGSSLTRAQRYGWLDFTTGSTDQFLAGGTTRPILPVGNAIIEEIWAYSAGTPTFNLGDDAATPDTLVASITLTAATWTKLPLLKNSTDHDDVYCDFTAGGAATRIQIKYRTISLA